MKTEVVFIQLMNLPSPQGTFLLGHLPQFNAPNKYQVLERWVEACSDLFQINLVGKRFIVFANPVINDQILRM